MKAAPTALAVIADLPFPPRSGNHLRDLQTLDVLGRLGYSTSVVAATRSWEGERSLGPSGSLDTVLDVADESRSFTGRLGRAGRLVRSTAGRGPGPWALNYAESGLDRAVLEAVERHTPTVAVLRSTFAHLVPALRDRVESIVLDVHDAETFQARSLLPQSRGVARLGAVLRLQAAKSLDARMNQADELWIPSQREIDHYARVAPSPDRILVRNGVPVPEHVPARDWTTHRLLLVGGFGYPPNEAAAVRLVEGILPQVRHEVPDAEIVLVGRDLRPELRSRWSELPVSWRGVVEELDPVYAEVAALVLPYPATTVTGTPLKVSEALAKGVPVVAAPTAVDGLGVEPGRHVLVGRTDDELARHAVTVLRDRARAEELANAGHAWAREHLAPDRLATRLRQVSILGRACA